MTTAPDPEGFFAKIGIDIARVKGSELFALCPNPAHKDHRVGSWSANVEQGKHYCFSCDYHGTLLDLAIDQGFTAWEASGLLHRFGLHQTKELPESLRKLRENRAPEIKFMEEEVLEGLVDPPQSRLHRRHMSLEAAQRYGIRWDAKRKLWVLPIRMGPGGRLMGWQEKGPGWFNNEPEGVLKSHTLFGIEHLEPATPAILVESPLDAARIYSAGFAGAVAAFGVSVADEQMLLLSSVTNEVILALDNDDAGRKATYRLITGRVPGKTLKRNTAWGGKFKTWVFNYGDSRGSDPGELTDDEIEFGLVNAVLSTEWTP